MSTPDLKPRAIAVLVALRSAPRTTRQLRDAIGDGRKSDPNGLLRSMRDDHRLVTMLPHDDRWHLTHDGIGWLQSHGLDAVPEARAWVRELDEHFVRMQPVFDAINEGMAKS